jgi:hypothetical protein
MRGGEENHRPNAGEKIRDRRIVSLFIGSTSDLLDVRPPRL